jgi:hypothetical protein
MGKDTYAQYALEQIPRILGNQDRNPFSPSYGCFHRDYWLDKTSDFPDAVRQFGVQALALVYANEMPNNIYYKNPKILDWTIAGIDYWCKIQHSDGSFDEFYPNERGWVGPTAFTTYAVIGAYEEIENDIPIEKIEQLKISVRKAADFIAKGDQEEDHLANHHAMACLALWKSYKLLEDPNLLDAYKKAFNVFLEYHESEEGWSREYDGIDPGYLSATVSFLGKIYKDNQDPDIERVCNASIKTCSYFVYPNGFYAGSAGSRNTLHFYSHGFEIFGANNNLAEAVAEKMLTALGQSKLVPPSIMSDRYLFYRVPEYLQSYLDSSTRSNSLAKLPYEEINIEKYFKKAKIFIKSTSSKYIVINAAKGGVTKVFNCEDNSLLINDCGIIGALNNGKIISSQWIDEAYEIELNQEKLKISGKLNYVPSNKYFNVPKQILFRSFLLFVNFYPPLSHALKGWIRKILMLGTRPVELRFERTVYFKGEQVKIIDRIKSKGKSNIVRLYIGDEFFVRYVPQSRYFQSQELEINGREVGHKEINKINTSQDWVEV